MPSLAAVFGKSGSDVGNRETSLSERRGECLRLTGKVSALGPCTVGRAAVAAAAKVQRQLISCVSLPILRPTRIFLPSRRGTPET